jgi:2-hydroxy-3-keto-5-methylthiopentenyl-1-phosphate phosphatase
LTDKQFKIFLDFDGTITRNDVGEEIFRKFVDEKIVSKIVDDLLTDKISSRECWESLCESALAIDKTHFDEFILSQEVEPSLQRFAEYCEESKFELFVLSDGFDYYIDKILMRERLGHLKVYSNKLILDDDGKLIPHFPYYNADCRSSANCKRNHIIENSGEEEYTVFIGDGNSDNDAIQYVDFIFAKADLLKFCEVQRITYFPFKNFDDVIIRLTELSSRKRLKKRHQAELKRREAFMIE